MTGRALTIDITTRDQQTLAALKRIQRELGQLDKSIETTARQGDKLGASADEYARTLEQAREIAGGIVLGGTVAVLGGATVAAGNLAEAQIRVDTTFKESAASVNAFAEGATDALGLSKRAALDSAAGFGNLFTQLGLAEGQAAQMSATMVTLGADFAAYRGANPEAVMEAQAAAFRGEYDALQRYIPSITAATIEKRALADTGKTNAKELTAQERALATYAIMVESAGDADGAAARSKDTLRGSTQRARAELENSAATMGQSLVPIAADAAQGVAALAGAFGVLPGPMQAGIVGVGGLVLGLGLLGPRLREGAEMMRAGITVARQFGSETATTATKVQGAAVGVGALSAALVAGVAAWQQWGAAGRGAAGDWVGKFDQANGRTVEGMRRTAEESRAWAAALEESHGAVNYLPDLGDVLDIDYNRSVDEARSAANEKADAFDAAAARVEEAARRSGMTVTEAEQGLVAQGIDPTIMSTEKLIEVLGRHANSAASTAQATNEQTAELDRQAEAADRARSAVDAFRSAEEGVASAQDAVVAAKEQVVDAERGVAEARESVADAARGVQDAERGLAEARQGATEAALDLAEAEREQRDGSDELRSAQEGVADAERALAEAQAESLATQEALNDARATATERLEDLRRAVEELPLDEREARLRLAQAQERQAELDSESTALDREAAAIAVARAEIALREALEEAAEQRAELAEQEALGVEQSPEVVAAKDAITEAAEREKDAQGRLTEAQAAVVEAQEQMTERVVEAQRRVQEANDRVREAADRVRDANGQVVEAQQRVIDQQATVVEARGAVEEAERGVTEALAEQVIKQGELNEAMGNAKGALDDQIVKLLEFAGQMEPGSPVRARLEEMAAELNALTGRPWTIELQTALVAVSDAQGAAQSLVDRVVAATGGRATGGRIGRGQRRVVGEHGLEFVEGPVDVLTPEQAVVRDRQEAAVAERDRRRSAADRGKVEQTFHITVQEAAAPWVTVDLIGRQFERAMRTTVPT
jgi:hypothetical protein